MHIFIDTTYFDETRFNFSSPKVSTLLAELSELNPVILLPDPTYREIRRHMKDCARKAAEEIKNLEKQYPLLRSSRSWKWHTSQRINEFEIFELYEAAFEGLKSKFTFEPLGYQGVCNYTVMHWYDTQQPPFGSGKKAKEFPDAFAIAILDAYAERNNCQIAVISRDGDMKSACRNRPFLQYFESLEFYLQAHLKSIELISLAQGWSTDQAKALNKAIEEKFRELPFSVDGPYFGTLENLAVIRIEVTDFYVVGISSLDISVTMNVRIDYNISYHYEDRYPENNSEDDDDDPNLSFKFVDQSDYFSTEVVAKLELGSERSKISGIDIIDFGTDNFEVQIP